MADPDIDIPVAFAVPVPVPVTGQPCPSQDQPTSSTSWTEASSTSCRLVLPSGVPAFQGLSSESLRELREQGYTEGLASSLSRKKQSFPLTIWVVDNSGSMATRDGHRLVSRGKNELQVIPCTRWSEMQQTVEYHAQMAALLKSPTIFRLLNDPGRVVGPQQFSVAERGDAYLQEDLAIAYSTIQNTFPGGVTPLVGHLREIHQNVKALEPTLRHEGTKVAIILATDGIPTDDYGYSNDAVKREFAQALRSFEGLPVWIVVRLCTDEASVVNYWNQIDSNLELSIEVLDDFTAEAEEIHQHNKWLNYGLPLHRMREMGCHDRVFDIIDERKLAKEELGDFFRILFGKNLMDGVPAPEVDWDGFVERISSLIHREEKQWNPLTRRLEPWVDIRQLKRDYGSGWFFW